MEINAQLYTPPPLTLENKSWYSLDKRLGGPQNQAGCFREEQLSYSCRDSDPGLSSLYLCRYTKYSIQVPTWKHAKYKIRDAEQREIYPVQQQGTE